MTGPPPSAEDGHATPDRRPDHREGQRRPLDRQRPESSRAGEAPTGERAIADSPAEEVIPDIEIPPRPQAPAAARPLGPGAALRTARIDRGLSIPEVERDTRINRRYLEAIEAEQFDRLPAPVYVRGFVRSYARYVGIDDDEMVAALPADLPRPAGLDPLPGLRAHEPGALPQVDPRLVVIGGVAVAGLALIFIVYTWIFGGGIFGGGLFGGDDGLPDALDAPATTSPIAGDGETDPNGAGPVVTPTGTGDDAAAGGDDRADDAAPPPADAVPPFEVGETPDFIGVSLEAANEVLDQLDLESVVIEAQNPSFAPGTIFAQTPEPGSDLDAEDVVTLIVARAEETAAP